MREALRDFLIDWRMKVQFDHHQLVHSCWQFRLLLIKNNGNFKAAVISASRFAFVLLFYDFIYLKLYLGKGPNYLLDYWDLTFFSPIPYAILLPIGHQLDKET